jgi:hypothetical protein
MPRTPMLPWNYTCRSFVEDVLKASAEGEKHFNGDDRRLLQRHRVQFKAAVTYLETVLVEGQPNRERRIRLHKLHQALGSISILASHHARTPAAERQGRKLSDRGAQERRSEQEPIDAVIIAEARLIWPKYKSYTSWRIAGEILPAVETELTAKGLPPRKQRAIATRLEKLRHLIIN